MCTLLKGLINSIFHNRVDVKVCQIFRLKVPKNRRWFPGPPLAVSNDKSTTQRLSVFVGHSPGVGYPSSRFIPDKLLSPWRVSSGDQPDSLSPGSIYNIYKWLFTIKIFFNKFQLIFVIYFVFQQNATVKGKGNWTTRHAIRYNAQPRST